MAQHTLTLKSFLSLGQSVGNLLCLLRLVPSEKRDPGPLLEYREMIRSTLRHLGEQIEDFRPVVDEYPLFISVREKAAALLHGLPVWIGTREYRDAVESQTEDGNESHSDVEPQIPSVVQSLYDELTGLARQHDPPALHVFVVGAVAPQLEEELGWCPMNDLGILPEGPSVLEMSQLEFPSQQSQPPDGDAAPAHSHDTDSVVQCHTAEQHLRMFQDCVQSKIGIELQPHSLSVEGYQDRTRQYVHGYQAWLKDVLDQWIKSLSDELGRRPISRIGQGTSEGHLDEIRMTLDSRVHAKLRGMTSVVCGRDDDSRAANVLRALCAIEEDSIDSSKLKTALDLEKPVKPGTLRKWAHSIREALKKAFGEDAACWTRVVSVRKVEELHIGVLTPPFYDGERCPRLGCGHRYTLNEAALRKCPECGRPHKDYQRSPKTLPLDTVSPLDVATTDPEPQD